MKKGILLLVIMILSLFAGTMSANALDKGDSCIIIMIGFDGQTEVGRVAVNYGEPYVPAPLPDQPGVKFVGWYTKNGLKADFTSVQSHMIIYARCEVSQYQVTFYDSNGLMVGSSTVQYGKAAFPPSNLVTEQIEGKYKYALIWNQDYSCITSNLVVQGTRVKQLIPGNPYTDAGGINYKAISENEVRVVGSKKGKNLTKLVIPQEVNLGGVKCRVLGISANAFTKCQKLTKVTIGSKITYISSKAFSKCTRIKTITIKSNNLQEVGKKAFEGINKKAVLHVPKGKVKVYKKLLRKAGLSSKIKVK